jgi:hypothetical protein
VNCGCMTDPCPDVAGSTGVVIPYRMPHNVDAAVKRTPRQRPLGFFCQAWYLLVAANVLDHTTL